jgi:curved DNA-binding protein CbpA
MLSLFGLLPNFSQQDLKKSYKELLLKHHPDKTENIQTTPTFKLITACFMKLQDNLKARMNDKTHSEFKKDYKVTQETQQARPAGNGNGKFNIKEFNVIYEKNRLKDPNDVGYEKWTTDESTINEKRNNTIVVYKEPQPLYLNIGKSEYYELGLDKIQDFSSKITVTKDTGISYMDLRAAHTTKSLIDESKIKQRKEYKSIKDLEADRAQVRFDMNEKELKAYHKKQALEKAKEEQRLVNMSHHDNKIEDHFQLTNNLLSYMRR